LAGGKVLASTKNKENWEVGKGARTRGNKRVIPKNDGETDTPRSRSMGERSHWGGE